jgi:hypothetical protein
MRGLFTLISYLNPATCHRVVQAFAHPHRAQSRVTELLATSMILS